MFSGTTYCKQKEQKCSQMNLAQLIALLDLKSKSIYAINATGLCYHMLTPAKLSLNIPKISPKNIPKASKSHPKWSPRPLRYPPWAQSGSKYDFRWIPGALKAPFGSPGDPKRRSKQQKNVIPEPYQKTVPTNDEKHILLDPPDIEFVWVFMGWNASSPIS